MRRNLDFSNAENNTVLSVCLGVAKRAFEEGFKETWPVGWGTN